MKQRAQCAGGAVTANCKEQKLLERTEAGNRIDGVQERGIKLRYRKKQIEGIIRYAFCRFLCKTIECYLQFTKKSSQLRIWKTETTLHHLLRTRV